MDLINTPIKIGSKTVRNRVTFAPTVKFGWTDDSGIAIERFARHYEDRARGGAGLICVEATCIDPYGRLAPSQLGLWDDSQIEGHRAIAEACHRHGAVVIVQIHHGGYNTHPECGPSKGPSSVNWRDRTTEALTREEITDIRDKFIKAAVRAKKAGYDGVQLHACHAYLLNQFVSPTVNLRTDEYGGSTTNRTRLFCEIIRGIRDACGNDFIISARTPGAEPTLEEAWAIADAYIEAGVDYLQVSSGIGPDEVAYPEDLTYSRIAWLGVQMHAHVGGRVPVSVVNGILKPEQARFFVENGLADTVDSARALLADPNWARAVTDGSGYVECRNCKICFWSPFMPHKCPAVAERSKTDPDCVDIGT
ncbi:MAG: NADH:flavin oxidoreductase [Clostridiales bacterium]|nr:NADH:flavin oxidoreductase [Clostridiales bacterium]